MLFNSLHFAIFLPVVFALYWFVFNRSLKWQNLLVVAASYVFYGWWDWRFLVLIAFTSLWAWAFGVMDLKWERGRKLRMALSVVVNLGILGVFKYYNFFSAQAEALLNSIGFHADLPTVKLILPVGISFYTFQALSYTIDVYRKSIVPTKDPVAFFAFISFFPQLVAGPIERATNLLPQFERPRTFDYATAVAGMRQILWGLFKKMVIADNCAKVVDTVWKDYQTMPSIALAIAAVMFAFQIYGDFSGYSDIAIGTAKLFGVTLKKNFHYPYFSRDIAEFWRRWHISLNTWFRDYLYIPLGGSREGRLKTLRNTMIIFLVCGLWHGANWTFVLWGAFNAVLFIPLLLANRNRKNLDVVAQNAKFLPSVKETVQMAVTFALVVFGWIIFRAPTITDAWEFVKRMATDGNWTQLIKFGSSYIPVAGLVLLLLVEWLARRHEYALEYIPIKNKAIRWCGYIALFLYILQCDGGAQEFIYFQF